MPSIFRLLHSLRATTYLGLAALACLFAYAVYELQVGRVEYLFWACNVATLLVAIGLLFRLPTINAVGLLWLVIGLPLWILDMLTGVGCHIFSVFTHVGGLLLGLAGTRYLGLPQGGWWRALAALYLLHVASRWVTPEDENINLAFRVWQGWEGYFSSHRVYILLLMAGTGVLFFAVEFALRKSGFARQRCEGTD
jgi:hypothetical protein